MMSLALRNAAIGKTFWKHYFLGQNWVTVECLSFLFFGSEYGAQFSYGVIKQRLSAPSFTAQIKHRHRANTQGLKQHAHT
jgi:hypothetical protein